MFATLRFYHASCPISGLSTTPKVQSLHFLFTCTRAVNYLMVLHCQVNQALVLYNCLQGPTLKEFSTLISTQIVIFPPRSNFILYCSLDSQSETPSDTWIHGLPFFILKTEVSDQANPDSSNPGSITFR